MRMSMSVPDTLVDASMPSIGSIVEGLAKSIVPF